jgi:hypothetical protein
VPACPTSSLPTSTGQTTPATLDTERGKLIFCLQSVEESLALDLTIAAFIVSVIAFAVSGGECSLIVRLGVFQALESCMVVATS